MKEMPDVLSGEEMDKAYCLADLHEDKFGHHAIAQAQRDADVAWFKEAGYVKLAEDQSLPDSPFAKAADSGDMHAQSRTSGYYCSQQDMLKAGFVKVEPKEESGFLVYIYPRK